MKCHVFSAVLVCACLGTVSGIAQSKAERRQAEQMRAQLQKDIEYLASDSLEGRRTGTEGERKAAAYIVKRYKQMGIFPLEDMYRYHFKFNGDKEPANSSLIRIGDNALKIGKDAFPMAFSSDKRAYSEIIPDVMEQNSIWLLPLYKDSAEADNPHFDWEKAAFEMAGKAAKESATGILFYDPYDSKYAPEFNGKSDIEQSEIPAAFISYKAYQQYVMSVITDSTTITLPLELNLAVKRTDRFGNNIAAYIDNDTTYTVVLGAHYDHLGYGEDGNSLHANHATDRAIHNGADDNASGTAAILALADMIKKNGLKGYNYMFVNFSGEELGLYGSKAFVKDLGIDSSRVAYMINLDMVGRLNDSTHALTVGGVGTSPDWAAFLATENKNFKIVTDSAGVGPSDHTSFYNANIPVLFFFTGTHSDYHKPSDDADKINYPGEIQIINYVYSLIGMMDGKPKPAFTATKAPAVGKTRFKVTLGIMPDYTYQEGGVKADGVTDGKPAALAGVKAGDIIIQLGEHKIQGMQSYMQALGKFQPGEKSTVTVKRGGEELVLPIEFGGK
ncbi:MAG: M20/M25/M40 family metallo-hydrolase [Flavipsychrobacter sp.]|nr:M20/M25/M40 family metallo-hydrolase [Flavipsychrobacter sp.]